MDDYENWDNQIVAEYHISSYFDVPEDIAEMLSKCNRWYVKYDTLYIQLENEGEWLEFDGTTEGFDFKRPSEIVQGDRVLENGDNFSELKLVELSDKQYELEFAAEVKAKDSETLGSGSKETLDLIGDTLLEALNLIKRNPRLSDRNIEAIEKVLFNVNNAIGVIE